MRKRLLDKLPDSVLKRMNELASKPKQKSVVIFKLSPKEAELNHILTHTYKTVRQFSPTQLRQHLKTPKLWGQLFLHVVENDYKDAFNRKTEREQINELDYLWRVIPTDFRSSCFNDTFPTNNAFKEENVIENALLSVINKHAVHLIEWFLNHQANLNVRDENGNTAFMRLLYEFPRPEQDHLSLKKGYVYAPKLPDNLFQLCLSNGADVFARNNNQDTTIMAAHHNPEVIETLVSRGVHIAARNKDGENVFDIMQNTGVIFKPCPGGNTIIPHPVLDQKLKELFLKYGVNPTPKMVKKKIVSPNTNRSRQHE